MRQQEASLDLLLKAFAGLLALALFPAVPRTHARASRTPLRLVKSVNRTQECPPASWTRHRTKPCFSISVNTINHRLQAATLNAEGVALPTVPTGSMSNSRSSGVPLRQVASRPMPQGNAPHNDAQELLLITLKGNRARGSSKRRRPSRHPRSERGGCNARHH